MRQCPGIYFADEASGRTAKIGVKRTNPGYCLSIAAGVRAAFVSIFD